jgi:hypothetical protein
MSIKRRSLMLLIKMRLDRKFPIVIPVSLAVLDGTFEEAANWLGLWKAIFGKRKGYQLAYHAAQGFAELLKNIRKVGRLRLVEVEAPEVSVSVDLW